MSAGVTCVKCHGRLTEDDFATSRKLQGKLRPGRPFVPPKVCKECVWMTILSWEEGEDKNP